MTSAAARKEIKEGRSQAGAPATVKAKRPRQQPDTVAVSNAALLLGNRGSDVGCSTDENEGSAGVLPQHKTQPKGQQTQHDDLKRPLKKSKQQQQQQQSAADRGATKRQQQQMGVARLYRIACKAAE